MTNSGTILTAVVLFLLGVRLSAFFSGSETGFYRVSFLRLSIDANAGDPIAKRLLWFARNPSYFVATTLVGTNVANYLTTFAIGLAVVTLFPAEAGWIEITATLAIAPIIFLSAELLPKNLYYRAPLHFLRRDAAWLTFFYYLFLAISLPLIGITKLIERWQGTQQPKLELLLGRSRLVQVLSHGHPAGLLTSSQARLLHGLLHTAAQPVGQATMIAAENISGVSDGLPVDEVLAFVAENGLSRVAVRRAESVDDWYGQVGVIELAIGTQPLSAMIRPMPRVDASESKLNVLRILRSAGNEMCIVTEAERIVGFVSERSLVEEWFTAPRPIGISASPENVV